MRDKPLITITGPEDPQDMKDMMLIAARAFKHSDSCDVELVTFFRDEETNLVLPAVKKYYDDRGEKRAQPPQKPATAEEMRDKVHAGSKVRMPVRPLPNRDE